MASAENERFCERSCGGIRQAAEPKQLGKAPADGVTAAAHVFLREQPDPLRAKGARKCAVDLEEPHAMGVDVAVACDPGSGAAPKAAIVEVQESLDGLARIFDEALAVGRLQPARRVAYDIDDARLRQQLPNEPGVRLAALVHAIHIPRGMRDAENQRARVATVAPLLNGRTRLLDRRIARGLAESVPQAVRQLRRVEGEAPRVEAGKYHPLQKPCAGFVQADMEDYGCRHRERLYHLTKC